MTWCAWVGDSMRLVKLAGTDWEGGPVPAQEIWAYSVFRKRVTWRQAIGSWPPGGPLKSGLQPVSEAHALCRRLPPSGLRQVLGVQRP